MLLFTHFCHIFIFQKVSRTEIGDVVILDADSNTVETPFDDLNNLPQDVVSIKTFLYVKFGTGILYCQ